MLNQKILLYPSIRICVNKIENRATFKIKTGYYLKILTPKTMKLLGNTKSKIIKSENGENISSYVRKYCSNTSPLKYCQW